MRGFAPITSLVVLLATASAQAQETEKPTERVSPPADEAQTPRYPPTSTRYKVMVAGLALTGASWGLSYFSATTNPLVPGINNLKIPVAGPWIALGHSGCSPDVTIVSHAPYPTAEVRATPGSGCGAALAFRGILMVLDGLVQLGGLGLVVEGIVMKTESAPPAAKESAFLHLNRGDLSVQVLPVVTPTMTGFGLVGTF